MTRRSSLIALAVLLALVLRVSAAGSAYYAAPTGSNANPCTLALPCQTVQFTIGKAKAGDTVYLRGGTYFESVKVTTSGTASQPIILQAYGQEAVTIDGGGSAALYDPVGTTGWWIKGLTLKSNANYVLALDSWGCNGTCGGSKNWTLERLTIYGAVWVYGNNVLFLNNVVDGGGTRTNGITETQPVSFNNRYLGNTVSNFTIRAFWTMQKTHDSLWQGNTAKNIGNLCLDLDGFGQVVYRHSVVNNQFSDCREAGIELENSFASTVTGNAIVNQTGDGIHVIQYGPFNTPNGAACGTTAGYGDTDGNNNCEGDPSNVTLANNDITITGLGVGIQIYQASDVQVTGNRVSALRANALYAYKFAYRVMLSGNTFVGAVGAFEPNALVYVTNATPVPPSATATRTATATGTPSPTPSYTSTPTATATDSLTPTMTSTETFTPSPTVTDTPLPTSTATPTQSCATQTVDGAVFEVCLRRVA